MTVEEARAYRPAALAFLGDSVYEVCIRKMLLCAGNQPSEKLHDQKVRYACAEYQAAGIDRIEAKLSAEERAIYKRGRNAAVTVPRRVAAIDYHKATGLEALFGYLSLLDKTERIDELFRAIIEAAQDDAEKEE